MLGEVYKKDQLNLSRLDSVYKDELLKKDITTVYHFRINDYIFHKLNESNDPLQGYSFATRSYKYGFKTPLKAISAWFPDPNLVFLQRMKWVLISSLLLIFITIFCFMYTIRTIFKQKKLAELKNDFVNNMTHELKTPVATINIAAEAIQDFNLSKASADEYIGIIRYQAAGLSQLIDGILKSVVAEQHISLNLARVNVNDLITQLIDEYKPQLEMANVTIGYQTKDEGIFLMADVLLLKNAIGNLIDNAIKYSKPGAQIVVSYNIKEGNIHLKIADNGVGIPEQYQDKVFDKFFRVPSGDIHNVKGYGLGLSYAKSIIELHDGKISLLSRENQGTEFIISLLFIYHETTQGSVA